MSQPVTNDIQSLDGDKIRWLIVALLTGILGTQVLILFRMPASSPTIRAVQNAKTDDARTELLLSIPLVRIQGGTVNADITGTVDVEVQNTPLGVEVYR